MARESLSDTLESPRRDGNLNTVFSALGHPARRRVLATIHERQPRSSGGLAIDAFIEDDGTSEHSPTELYHSHLPKLDSAGFIDWDCQTNTVARGPRFDEIEPVLDVFQTNQTELPGDWP